MDLVKEKLGINQDKLIKHIRLVKLMAWEQVLLLCWYARRQYYDQNQQQARHFHARMEMVELAKGHEQLTPFIYQCLDSGAGYNGLLNQLGDAKAKYPSLELRIAAFLSACEDKGISFSPTTEPPLYPYHAMYISLNRTVDIFQALLKIGDPEQFFEDIACSVISENKFQIRTWGLQSWIEPTNEKVSLESKLNAIKQNHELGSKVGPEIDRRLGIWMNDAFNLFNHPHNSQTRDQFRQGPENVIFCNKSQNISKNEITLTFDRDLLATYLSMGQESELMNVINRELQSLMRSSVFRARSAGDEGVGKASLSEWFSDCSVTEIPGTNSIPQKVATILDFDVRYSLSGVGFFRRYAKSFFAKEPSNTEAASVTTAIINNCLYHATSFERLLSPSTESIHHTVDPKVALLNLLKKKPENKLFPDQMMKSWSNNDERKMKERFKRPRAQIEKDILDSEGFIREQKARGMKTPYPISSEYPLPLWVFTMGEMDQINSQ